MAPAGSSAFWAEARGQHWISGNAFSPHRCASPFIIKLRTCHSSLTNDVVELAIGQISPMGVWKLDHFAVVDPEVTVVTVMVLHPCKVALDKVIVNF